MRRREFITLLGTTLTAWPLSAQAQQPAMPVIGFLGTGSPEVFGDRLRAFRQGLSEAGYVEGENVAIVYRFAENQALPELAADLVRRKVAVIATGGPPATFAARRQLPGFLSRSWSPMTGAARFGRKPLATGQQHDRNQCFQRRGSGKAVRTSA